MRYVAMLLTLSTILAENAWAEQPIVLQNKDNSLALSIYNKDLALVKDSRMAGLSSGINEVIFDGVAENIQSETAIIYGQDISVLEQNYSYNLMTNNSMIEASVGQEVTTVRENQTTGENIFEKAVIIGAIHGMPILKFNYGIEANFPGRIIFNTVPNGVSNKPTLQAKIKNNKGGDKRLNLAYLTRGLNWKTDYVANITANNTLDLTGWVTITNESGIDYKNAKIQLVAGDVNVVQNNFMQPKMMMMTNSFARGMATDEAVSIEPEEISSYELYTLPNITTINNHQNKQIGLIEKNAVKYKKDFTLNSPLYLGGNNEFKKAHPDIAYVMENNNASNLGISLPQGTVRFYENDKNGNLQFIGANTIGNTAKNETLRLNLGKAFNIVANGKITNIKEKELKRVPQNSCFMLTIEKTYNAEINFNNAEKSENDVIFKQNVSDNAVVISESSKSTKNNAGELQWIVKVPAEGNNTLKFSISIKQNKRSCD